MFYHSNQNNLQLEGVSEEEALSLIIEWLKKDDPQREPNCDLPVPRVIGDYLYATANQTGKRLQGMITYDTRTNAESFYSAAWDLCLHGILYPVPSHLNDAQNAKHGVDFNLTQYGRSWLASSSGYETVPTNYARFSSLLQNYKGRFGSGYYSRSQEAIGCYRSHHYHASCVMSGAATESILLAIAIQKKGSEDSVVKDYCAANGRSRIENFIIGNKTDSVKRSMQAFLELLKYWRDFAGHGLAIGIGEEEAYTSLLLLLRFAQYADDRWDELTQ